jgi:hypothetical protein
MLHVVYPESHRGEDAFLLFETGRAVVNVQLEELGRRRPKTPQDFSVRPNLPVLPKLSRTSRQAVDPKNHCP